MRENGSFGPPSFRPYLFRSLFGGRFRFGFQRVQGGIEFLHELNDRHVHRAAKSAQFDGIDAPLAAFTARNEDLVFAQSLRESFLRQPRR